MTGKITGFVAAFMFIFNLLGCGDSDFEKALGELKAARQEIRSIEMENKKLLEENLKFQGKIELLESEKKRLLVRLDEMRGCSLKLADSYGPGIWDVDEFMCPVFLRSVRSGKLTEIVEELNKSHEKEGFPKIFLRKIDNRVAFVGLEDEVILTQQMGSHGATSFIKSVTYSLASVKGIDCVFFMFEWGDHAVPGKYCR